MRGCGGAQPMSSGYFCYMGVLVKWIIVDMAVQGLW